jgi:hypothetical protein
MVAAKSRYRYRNDRNTNIENKTKILLNTLLKFFKNHTPYIILKYDLLKVTII